MNCNTHLCRYRRTDKERIWELSVKSSLQFKGFKDLPGMVRHRITCVHYTINCLFGTFHHSSIRLNRVATAMREIDEDIRPNTPYIQSRRRNRDKSVRSCDNRWADQQGAALKLKSSMSAVGVQYGRRDQVVGS